jgi:ubiquinone/menaquinone biosynthesis C-methylase UbiE
MSDAEALRQEIAERWERAAPGWGTQRAVFQAGAQPVSQWLIEAVDPQPGLRILELAAGPGDTGLLAAELLRPHGTLILTDISEGMLEVARARAQELGITNVEFRAMDAEWIDLPPADVDGVICRWGYMLMADPGAALRETRRVLKPGGTVALAVWAGPEHNLWASVPIAELVRMGAIEPPDPNAPGMFAWRDPAVIAEALEEAGFVLAQVDQVDLAWRFPSLDDWWDSQLELSVTLREAVTTLTPAQRDELRDAIDERLADFVAADGSIALPARTHVAAASA